MYWYIYIAHGSVHLGLTLLVVLFGSIPLVNHLPCSGSTWERDFTISVTMTKEYDYQESKKSSLCVCFQILLTGDNIFYSFMFTQVFRMFFTPGLLYH